MDLRRVAIPAVIVALVIAAAIVMFTDSSGQRTVTAYSPRTISLYEGSEVRVLGVTVGAIDQVKTEGTRVKVTMHYDEDVKIPSEAEAVIISPSITSSSGTCRCAPAYTSGEVLKDNATLDESRTSVPLKDSTRSTRASTGSRSRWVPPGPTRTAR